MPLTRAVRYRQPQGLDSNIQIPPTFLKPLPSISLPSILLFPQHILDEPLSSSERSQGDQYRRLLLHGAEMGMDMLPKRIVQGKGGWIRSVEWAGVNPQAMGPTDNYIMMTVV